MIQNPEFEDRTRKTIAEDSGGAWEVLAQLESQIEYVYNENRVQTEHFEQRLNALNERLGLLTDQLAVLIAGRIGNRESAPGESNSGIDGHDGGYSSSTDKQNSENQFSENDPEETESQLPSPTPFDTPASDDVSRPMGNPDEPNSDDVADVAKLAASPATSRKNESVADVLARLKADGQWDGLEDDGDESPPTTQQTSQPSLQASETNNPGLSSTHLPAEMAPQPAAPAGTTASRSGGDDVDVNDYMAELLSRMRGDNPPPPLQPAPQVSNQTPVTPTTTTTEPISRNAESQIEFEQTEVMTEEEFRPRQKAAPIQSLSAMREIANSNARTAVASSEENRRNALAYVQLAIAVASLAMSGYYFGVATKAIGDTPFILGSICVLLTGFLAFRFFTTMNQKPQNTDELE